MQRRKFLAAAAALPLTVTAASPEQPSAAEMRQLIELRTYEIKFGGSGKATLLTYLKEVLTPTLKRHGVPTVHVFQEMGLSDPAKVWVLIAYPMQPPTSPPNNSTLTPTTKPPRPATTPSHQSARCTTATPPNYFMRSPGCQP